ncbi:hypothetical protein [Hymenobacter sp. HSC-4F20]|nr:hypothetical protein [Hymenobacter sp. HSC-4F20]
MQRSTGLFSVAIKHENLCVNRGFSLGLQELNYLKKSDIKNSA